MAFAVLPNRIEPYRNKYDSKHTLNSTFTVSRIEPYSSKYDSATSLFTGFGALIRPFLLPVLLLARTLCHGHR